MFSDLLEGLFSSRIGLQCQHMLTSVEFDDSSDGVFEWSGAEILQRNRRRPISAPEVAKITKVQYFAASHRNDYLSRRGLHKDSIGTHMNISKIHNPKRAE